MFFLLFLCMSLSAVSIDVQFDSLEHSHADIDVFLATPVPILDVHCVSDIPVERDEFLYLTSWYPGMQFDASACKRGLAYLARKKHFSCAQLTIHQGKLEVYLVGVCRLKELHISGVSSKKDQYEQVYLIERGELFDEKKHAYGKAYIAQELRDDGYLNAQIVDRIVYDEADKTVQVFFTIKKNKQFKITACVVQGVDDLPVHQELYAACTRALNGKTYRAALLNKQGKKIKEQLAYLGYVQAQVFLEEQVDYRARTVTCIFTVEPGQRRTCVYQGNDTFTREQINAFFASYGTGALYFPSSFLAEELAQWYQKKGFLDVVVQVHEQDGVLTFLIQEGARIVVDQVVVHGATQDITAFIHRIPKARSIDDELLHAVATELTAWYRHAGYMHAQVSTSIQRIGGKCAVVLHINEGDRSIICKVHIPASVDLERQMAAYVGTPYQEQVVHSQKRLIADYVRKKGYVQSVIEPEVSYDKQGNTQYVTIAWHLSGADRELTFGKTVVVGQTSIPFRYMQRTFVQPNTPWDQTVVESFVQHCKELGIFRSVHIYPDVSHEGAVPIVAHVVDDSPFEFRLRAGALGVSRNVAWREGATYKVGGSFVWKNPCKRADMLSVDVDMTLFEQYASVYYRLPLFWGPACRMTCKGYSNRYKQPVFLGSNEPLYNAVQEGLVLELSNRYRGYTFGLTGGFEYMETELSGLESARAINFSPALVNVRVPYLYAQPTCVIDSLDNKVDPHAGFLTVISCKAMVPFHEQVTTFLKILFEQSWFAPLASRVVCAIRLRLGHIFNQKFSQIMPPERFFLGGPNSIRGYYQDLVPPLGLLRRHGDCQFVPQGGRSVCSATVEVRFPVYKDVYAGIFNDSGILIGDEFAALLKERFVSAVGCGLRYNTPVGPVRFDLGVRLNKMPVDQPRVAFFLTLGHAF